MRCTAAVIPAVERGLTRARDRERTVRYVLGDRGAGRGEHAVAQLDRGDQIGVAADEAVVADDGLVLDIAVVVDDHRAAAEVNALADRRVADIGQMRDLGAVADRRFFQLNEVADAAAVADHALRADIGERADRCLFADLRLIDLRAVDRGARADLRLFEDGVRADDRACADLAAGADVAAGQDDRACISACFFC